MREDFKIFISYSSKDRELRKLLVEELRGHLHHRKRVKYTLWDDENGIDLGENWKQAIDFALNESSGALLLVSASFAASEFINQEELSTFFKKKQEAGYLTLPILLRKYEFQEFEQLSALNFFKTYYWEYDLDKPLEKDHLLPFEELGEGRNIRRKELNNYCHKLANFIHNAVINHLDNKENRPGIETKSKPSQVLSLEQQLGFEISEVFSVQGVFENEKSKTYLLGENNLIVGLNLRNCNLEDISSLLDLSQLQRLDIQNNQIQAVSLDFLNAFSSLKDLRLSGNPINNIPKEIFDIDDTNVLQEVRHYLEERLTKEYKFKGQNYLLTIGIDTYQHWPPLRCAVKDVQDFTRALTERYNFDLDHVVPPLCNEKATKKNLLRTFREIAKKVTNRDNLIIYFSGHGHYDEATDTGYWIPVEAETGDDNADQFIDTAIVVHRLKGINSLHTFLIVDACFSGTLITQIKSSSRNEQYKSRRVLTSGRTEVVEDGPDGGNSPFAKGVISQLENNTKKHITATELIKGVKEYLATETKQIPVDHRIRGADDQGGDFTFHLKMSEPNVWLDEVHQDKELKDEQCWKEAQAKDSILAYNIYLQRFPEGRYVEEVKKKIKKILIRRNALLAVVVLTSALGVWLFNLKFWRPIPPLKVEANFSVDTNECLAPCTVSFRNTSENADIYHWDFGDGITSSLENPSHTFEDKGEYLVSLIAISNNKSDTTETSINVNPSIAEGEENEVDTNSSERLSPPIPETEEEPVVDLPSPLEVTNVAITKPPSDFSGDCPCTFTIEGKINVEGSGIVKYTWVRSDGVTLPGQPLDFSTSGFRTVNTSWTMGEAGRTYNDLWMQLKIIDHNEKSTSRVYFNLTCNTLCTITTPRNNRINYYRYVNAETITTLDALGNLPSRGSLAASETYEVDEAFMRNIQGQNVHFFVIRYPEGQRSLVFDYFLSSEISNTCFNH